MGNHLRRSLPTTAPLGSLRKHAGRNASEAACSVVMEYPWPGEGTESVEPLGTWRRLERCTAGQDTRMSAGGIGAQGQPRVSPEDRGIAVCWLSGVAGAACVESIRGEAWEIQAWSRSLPGNRSKGTEGHIWKSERSVVVMTTGTTQPCTSEGAVLSQRLCERRWPAYSSWEVLHA